MVKYFALFFAFTIADVNIYAQSVQYYTSATSEDNDNPTFHLFDQDSLNLYAFRVKERNYYLDVFEKETLKRSSIIKIPLPSRDTSKYDLETLFIGKDTFRIFYSYFDKNSASVKLEMIVFDKRGVKIGESRLIDMSEGRNERKAGGFSVFNRKKYNEFLSYGYKRVKDTSYINIDHFNYSGIKTHEQYFALDNSAGYVVHSSIDDDCNIYHLTRSKLGNRNVNWSIKFYSPQSDQPKIIGLKQPSLDKIYLSNFFKTYIDRQQRINLLSPYLLSPSSKSAEGVYLAQIDLQTHTLVAERVIPFQLHKDANSDENDFSLSSCIITAIVPMRDKGLKIVFESRLETTTSIYGVAAAKQYDIGNIITVDIDSNYVATDIHNIKKQQHTNVPGYKFTGFAILNKGDTSYFIYNELPGNLQRSADKMKKVNSSKIDETAVIYTVVESGKVKRNLLIDKVPDSGIDAILPNSYISSFDKNEIYVLRRIKDGTYLTKFFIKD